MAKSTDTGARQYFGKYPGVVLDNAAPAGGHRGVLQIAVTGLVEDNPDGEGQRPMQVKALPCLPPGLFHVPPNGAHVWVEFAAGELDHPIWSGVWYAEGDETPGTTDQAGRLCLSDGKGNRVFLGEEGLILEDAATNKVSLYTLIDWLRRHRHLGNMGAPTPLFLLDYTDSTFWTAADSPGEE